MHVSAAPDIAALAYDGLCTFEFGVAVEVFALPRPELDIDWYEFTVCSQETGPIRAAGGVLIFAEGGLDTLSRAGTIVIPGWRDPDEVPPTELLDAIRSAHARGARLVSICSGVFVLAAAGVLDGRPATTHWRYMEKLRTRYPAVHLENDVLYVDDGDVLTSAGSAAGIDLCLHIVARDHGADIASQVARRLVVPPHREGGQAQYVPHPIAAGNGTASLATVMAWASERLDQPLTVSSLAEVAHMSPRTFARRFRVETGVTPYAWLIRRRLDAAQRLLETTDEPIESIAHAAGLGSSATLRHHFQKALGTTPTSYRRRFATMPRGAGATREADRGQAPTAR